MTCWRRFTPYRTAKFTCQSYVRRAISYSTRIFWFRQSLMRLLISRTCLLCLMSVDWDFIRALAALSPIQCVATLRTCMLYTQVLQEESPAAHQLLLAHLRRQAPALSLLCHEFHVLVVQIMEEILKMVRTHFEAATPSLPLSHNPSPPLVDGYASGGGIFRRPPKYSIVRLCKWFIRNMFLFLVRTRPSRAGCAPQDGTHW